MYNGGRWTKARYESFIKSVLRAGSRKWPPKYEVLNAAKRGKQINGATGRIAEHYECACCHSLFPAKSVAVDHIDSVVALTGFTTWDDVIARLFCEADGLQVLCTNCHKIKSNQEREERKLYKNNNIGDVNE